MIFTWIFFYITIKLMFLEYFDDQVVHDYLLNYKTKEAVFDSGFNEFESLKWWIGFDLVALFVDFISWFFGFGHLYMDLFGDEEIFYFYNPCNDDNLIYTKEGDIINTNTNEIFLEKNKVYYIKAVSLFCISSCCIMLVYYFT